MRFRYWTPPCLLAFLLLLLLGCQQGDGTLGRDNPTRVALGTVRAEPIPITFPTLNADPFAFLNRVIRVTGQYRPSRPVPCYPYKGILADWGIIADGFEMPVVGLVAVADVAQTNQELTIDGVWRRYEGPLGCGSQLENQVVWYLEVQQLVAPNPLGGVFVAGGSQTTIDSGAENELFASTGTPVPTLPSDGLPTDVPLFEATPTPNIGLTATAISINQQATAEAQGGEGATGSPTATLSARTSPTPQRGTAEPTPGPGTPTWTPSPTPTVDAAASPTPDDGSGLGQSGSGTRTPATPNPTGTADPYAPAATNTPSPYDG